MTRQEFIDELRMMLQGKISQRRVNEHLQYYENYIMEQSRKGKTEQQIIEELGDPRLIAKTLIDTENTDWEENVYDGTNEAGTKTTRGMHLNSWYGKILLIIIAVSIVLIVARVLAFLLPIVLPLVCILVVIMLIFGRKR